MSAGARSRASRGSRRRATKRALSRCVVRPGECCAFSCALQRKKTLLKEWEEKGRAGGIIDRRFGENDPSMGLEERMLERFTRERQRASKGVSFNLEDDD